MSERERRDIPKVDYAALEPGLSPRPFPLENTRKTNSSSGKETTVSSLPVDPPAPTEVDSLRSAIAAAKAENEDLMRNSELRALQRELAQLQQQNAKLKERFEDPPPFSQPLTVQDIRAVSGLSSRADLQLKKLGLSDSSSGSGDSEDEEDGHHTRRERSKRGKKLRSGKTAKLTSRVVHLQIWPHSELSLSYVCKEVSYDTLTLAEFAAGYASILRLPGVSAAERSARIDHFANLMYLATQFPWPLVRSLHAAVLFEIECGRLRWGDSFSHLEARLLHGSTNQSRSFTAATTRSVVQFCRAYQTGKCSSSKDHYGLIRNERKWVQHICAKCWLAKQEAQRHWENSAECPLNSSLSTTSSTVSSTVSSSNV